MKNGLRTFNRSTYSAFTKAEFFRLLNQTIYTFTFRIYSKFQWCVVLSNFSLKILFSYQFRRSDEGHKEQGSQRASNHQHIDDTRHNRC